MGRAEMTMTETIVGKIEGKTITIVGDIERNGDEGNGLVNLTVTVVESGESFNVGGAFFTIGGSYELFETGEAGDIAGLTEALGFDPEDFDTLRSVLDDLHDEADALFEAAADDIDAVAPKCSHDGGHRWEADPSDGNKENPGIWSVGGAAILVRKYCLHCGSKRERIVGDVNQYGNRNGVTYEEDALTEEELAELRAACGYDEVEE